MDVESFTTYLAACQMLHNADHVMKNYLFYASPEGRFTHLGWDLDLTHGRGYECGPGTLNDYLRHDLWDDDFGDDALLYGTKAHPKCDGFWNATIHAFLLRTDTFRPAYYRRLAETLPRFYHPDVLIPKIRRLAARIEEDAKTDRSIWRCYGDSRSFDTQIDRLVDWVPKRYRHLERKLASLGHRLGKPINADFDTSTRRGAAPLDVTFTDRSFGAKSFEWDFGDGAKSSKRSPEHRYATPGVYAVTLTVKGSAGEHTVVRRGWIRVTGPKVAKAGG